MQSNIFANFIQKNSPDGALKHTLQGKDFLQSSEWQKFQEAVGRKTYIVTSEDFYASVIEHNLPIVGKYFYVPRGPVFANSKSEARNPKQYQNSKSQIKNGIQDLLKLAKENNIGWIRIEPGDENSLEIIKKDVGANFKFVRSPHDMQPRELFIIDITKPEDQLLTEMKPKTRYNIRLAEKRGVIIKTMRLDSGSGAGMTKYIEEFLRLVKVTARRDGITPHPESYYRKMIEIIPEDVLKLYVAEYNGKVIAANLVVFFGNTCTYLHGASDNEHRSVMAPYLLQWRQIQDAKVAGCEKYDFGGIHTKTGEGITRFKLGFSPNTKPTKFPGCYDVVINPWRYRMYRFIQKGKSLVR